jgi:hypothetical protein
VDPSGNDYHLESTVGSYHGGAWLPDPLHSPCIDAGNPTSPYFNEPIPNGNCVNMGSYGNTAEASLSLDPSYPDLYIELTYVSGSPVPAGGGNLYFDVFVENQDIIPLDFDAWLEIAYEGGTPNTVVMRSFTNYQPGWAINRPGMFYPIAASYAAGNYTFTGKVGVHPDLAWAENGFPFEKLGTDHIAGFIPFTVDGAPNPFDEIIKRDARNAPAEFGMINAYPNPFNPITVVSYQLPVTGNVNLTVYDVSGRKVAELVDGWRDAGVHEVVFDATGLASGVYINRLHAGDFTTTGKMVLMK